MRAPDCMCQTLLQTLELARSTAELFAEMLVYRNKFKLAHALEKPQKTK